MSTKKNALSELYKIPVSEWAKLWCIFNVWEIPESLIHIKPEWWDDEPSPKKSDMMTEFLRPVMEEIVIKVGMKECNREWNRERMTDEEHEIFWNTKFDPEK